MRIVVLGASGGVGRALVEQALEGGDEVVAVVRSAARLPMAHERLRIVEAALDDTPALTDAFRDADAVASGLGISRSTPDQPPSDKLPNVVDAMRAAGVKRFVGVSGGAIEAPGDQKDLKGRVVSWLAQRRAPAAFEDKQRELDMLLAADLDWTLARAPRIVDGPKTGRYQVMLQSMAGSRVSRGDVADFLLQVIRERSYLRAAPFISD